MIRVAFNPAIHESDSFVKRVRGWCILVWYGHEISFPEPIRSREYHDPAREKGIYNECAYLRERKTHMSMTTTGSESLVPVTTLTPSLVQEIVKRIVDAVRPDQIVLFGSYAYGIPDKESDIDILVIMETDRPRHKRSVILNKVLAGLLIPKDLVVYTPEEVAEWKDVPQAFITQILKKGVILYDKNKKRSDPCMV
jgi:predicted nucleotidyltransferase